METHNTCVCTLGLSFRRLSKKTTTIFSFKTFFRHLKSLRFSIFLDKLNDIWDQCAVRDKKLHRLFSWWMTVQCNVLMNWRPNVLEGGFKVFDKPLTDRSIIISIKSLLVLFTVTIKVAGLLKNWFLLLRLCLHHVSTTNFGYYTVLVLRIC